VNRVDSSRYIYIRENSLEFNNPTMQAARGSCCGASLFKLAVRDNVTVMYFDDEHFDNGEFGFSINTAVCCTLYAVLDAIVLATFRH